MRHNFLLEGFPLYLLLPIVPVLRKEGEDGRSEDEHIRCDDCDRSIARVIWPSCVQKKGTATCGEHSEDEDASGGFVRDYSYSLLPGSYARATYYSQSLLQAHTELFQEDARKLVGMLTKDHPEVSERLRQERKRLQGG